MKIVESTEQYRKGFRGQYEVYPRPLDPTPQIEVEVDDEFVHLMPPLDKAALDQLRESLVAETCRDPLIAWQCDGRYLLLDGHNRLALCTEEDIPYDVDVKGIEEIPDRQAAIAWILRNQLGRRNLTGDEFALYLGKLYNAEKRDHGGDRKSSGQNVQLIGDRDTTAEKLAKDYGVNERTVRRSGKLAEAVDKAMADNPGVTREQAVLLAKLERKRAAIRKRNAKLKAERQERANRTDPDGRKIPSHLTHTFEVAEEIRSLALAIAKTSGEIERLAEAEKFAFAQVDVQGVVAKLNCASQALRLGAPHVVCVYCGGSHSRNCRGCKGTGFLSKARARCAPKEHCSGAAQEEDDNNK